MLMVSGTFIGVLTLVLGMYYMFVVRPEAGAHRALQKRLRPHGEAARKKDLTLAKTDEQARVTLFKRLQSTIDQSGKTLTVGGLLFGCSVCGLIVGLPPSPRARTNPASARSGRRRGSPSSPR